MERDAYRTLREMGLPYPRTFTIERLALSKRNQLLYLRSTPEAKLRGFIESAELRGKLPLLRRLIREGRIKQIESGIRSVNGGCAVVTEGGTFFELVTGHLSGLLRRGWCSWQVFARGGRIIARSRSQRQMV